jgi:hypothetical protein
MFRGSRRNVFTPAEGKVVLFCFGVASFAGRTKAFFAGVD